MRHELVADPVDEPCFELPPRLASSAERRLTMLAANADAVLYDYRDNAVTLEFDDARVAVVAVGAAVRVMFGLEPGRLVGGADDLAALLDRACAASRVSGGVVAFEAAVPAPAAACVLLRGVLLPMQLGAEAVLSWKEVLDEDATARLRAELLQALAAPRVARVDAFAR